MTAIQLRTVAIVATMYTASQRGAWMRKANKPSPAVYRLSTLLAIAPQMTTNRKGTRYQAGRTFGRFAIQRHCGWLLHIISVPNSSIFYQIGGDFRLVPNETDGTLQAVFQAYILFD